MGLAEEAPGWSWAGKETYGLALAVASFSHLVIPFLHLYHYEKLERRQITPKELAAALNGLVLPELVATVPVFIFFLFGGRFLEAIPMGLVAMYATVRFALGWSEVDPTDVYDKSRFRHIEGNVKMTIAILNFCFAIFLLVSGLTIAYGHHNSLMAKIRSGRVTAEDFAHLRQNQ